MRVAKVKRRDGTNDEVPAYTVEEYIPTCSRSSMKCRKKKYSYVLPFATFDIEATTIPEPSPWGFMYHWQVCLDGACIYGRRWEEFKALLDKLIDYFNLSADRRLVIYIMNMGYEFQFMKDFLAEWYGDLKVFAAQKRKPIRIETEVGLEFRCGYKLTNMSLLKFTENEPNCIHPKALGDLDYKKLRTADTYLNDEEFGYCISDVLGFWEAIVGLKDSERDNLETIPMTNTGYVRRDCRRACRNSDHYRDKVFNKNLLTADCYNMMRELARGGDTHANRNLAGRLCKDCDSFDIVSDYPFQMLARKYPMRKFSYYGEIESPEEMEKLLEEYACMFRVMFTGLRVQDHTTMPYIPHSKCTRISSGAKQDNGRILSTISGEDRGFLCITVNELDWEIIKDQYEWDELYISDFHIAKKDYLPEPIRHTVLEYYQIKTDLKDKIADLEAGEDVDLEELANLKYLYAKSKNRLNAIFGMCYTNPVHESIVYDGKEWSIEPADIEKELEKYNKSRNSFLVYAWGCWVTAWARWQLWAFTKIAGEETQVYRDTDSAKGFNFNLEAIEEFNKDIIKLCEERGAYADSKGKRYYMGIFEKENKKPIKEFITLGAKKYAYLDDKGLHVTVSGVSTRRKEGHKLSIAAEELGDIRKFKPGFKFLEAGGSTLWYNDQPIHTITVDGCRMLTASNIGMMDSEYTLGITSEYADLTGILDFNVFM